MEKILLQRQEYRIEVNENQRLKIMVLDGLAEIKGMELLNEKWYTFTKINTFIFTFTGCKLKIDGQCDLQYISSESNVPQIHSIFNYFMEKASGPAEIRTLMIVGSGRSTFCITLSNYFVRMHKKVMFTEIDPGRGNIFPGTLGSLVIDKPIDNSLLANNAICYYYGNTEIENTELYDLQTKKLVEAIRQKQSEYVQLILAPENTTGFYNQIIKKFEVDKVVVVGNERLYHKLDLIADKLYIKRTGYINDKNINTSISRYFNGPNNELTSYTITVKYKWKVVRIGEAHLAPDSALPLGSTRKIDHLQATEAELEDHMVMGISEAKSIEDVKSSPVIGFITVINKDSFRIMCTQPKLPKYPFFVYGNIKYVD